MSIPKVILNYLDKNKIKHEVIEHKTVFTALDLAKTEHLKPEQILKTLVLKLDGKLCVLASLSAGKNLDKAKFKNTVNAWHKKIGAKPAIAVDFAKEAWMKKNILGKVGATPPFGKLLKLPSFIDAAVLKNPQLLVNAGDYDHSLKISAKQWEKMEEPVRGSFSMAKPKKAKKQKGHKSIKTLKPKNKKAKKSAKKTVKKAVKRPIKKGGKKK